MAKFAYYRCTSAGPAAPLLKLTLTEAREMKNHPDYERVDEFGEVIENDDDIEGSIPFSGSAGRR